jgi:Uma2 family endonuclease
VAEALEKPEQDLYTYADYLAWDDGKRYELFGGTAYMMASPSLTHQTISMDLSRQFSNFLYGKKCRVFAAPFDVRLFPREDDLDDTVVQPDILVVCDPAKLEERGCKGAPDLVIEILSRSNAPVSMFQRLSAYLKAKVREYWVIFPEEEDIQTHVLDGDRYITKIYSGAGAVPVSLFDGFSIDFGAVFAAVRGAAMANREVTGAE